MVTNYMVTLSPDNVLRGNHVTMMSVIMTTSSYKRVNTLSAVVIIG